MKAETTFWSEFPNGGKAIVEDILASEERNESRKAGLWESQSEIQVGKLDIWVKSFEIQKLKQGSQGLSVPLEPRIKTQKVIDGEKRSKALNKVNPIENINKNPQSSLNISLVQKEVFLSHTLKEHTYK